MNIELNWLSFRLPIGGTSLGSTPRPRLYKTLVVWALFLTRDLYCVDLSLWVSIDCNLFTSRLERLRIDLSSVDLYLVVSSTKILSDWWFGPTRTTETCAFACVYIVALLFELSAPCSSCFPLTSTPNPWRSGHPRVNPQGTRNTLLPSIRMSNHPTNCASSEKIPNSKMHPTLPLWQIYMYRPSKDRSNMSRTITKPNRTKTIYST